MIAQPGDIAAAGRTRVIATTFRTSSLPIPTSEMLQTNVGGTFLGMGIGTLYLLQLLGAVVLGGSLVMAGSSTAFRLLLGCMLLVLIIAIIHVAGRRRACRESCRISS